MDRIQKISRWLKILFFFGIFYQILPLFIYWVEPGWFGLKLDLYIGYRHLNTDLLTIGQNCLLLVLMMSTTALWVWIMWLLHNLFGYYERGKIFCDDATRLLSKITKVFFLTEIWSIIADFFLGIIVTFYQDKRLFVLNIDSEEVTLLVIAAILMLVTYIMHEAIQLKEEQALTV